MARSPLVCRSRDPQPSRGDHQVADVRGVLDRLAALAGCAEGAPPPPEALAAALARRLAAEPPYVRHRLRQEIGVLCADLAGLTSEVTREMAAVAADLTAQGAHAHASRSYARSVSNQRTFRP